MFINIIILLILIYLIYSIKCSWNMKKYKEISGLKNITIKDIDINSYDPYIFRYDFNNITLDNLIDLHSDKYFFMNNKECIRLLDFKYNDEYILYKNKEIINYLNNNDKLTNLINLFKNPISFNNINYGSIIKGNYTTSLLKNNNNILLLSILYGSCNVYLFNPKHYDSIKDKELDKIIKLSIQINLDKDKVIYIPTNWYYIVNIRNNCIIMHSQMDTYFTFIYNMVRT